MAGSSVSFSISPQEIKNKEFRRSAFGYAPREVVLFLDQIARTWERVQKTERDLRERVSILEGELDAWKGKEAELLEKARGVDQEIRRKVHEADREAQKAFEEIEHRAEEVRKKTEAWLEGLIQEINETEKQKTSFLTALRLALDSHYSLIHEETSVGVPLAERLNQFLKGFPGTAPCETTEPSGHH